MAENRRRSPIVGYGLPAAGTATPRHPQGRVCNSPGCETRLSVYNPDNNCALHEEELPVNYHRLRQLGMPR